KLPYWKEKLKTLPRNSCSSLTIIYISKYVLLDNSSKDFLHLLNSCQLSEDRFIKICWTIASPSKRTEMFFPVPFTDTGWSSSFWKETDL
ncbi:9325_t:CDS:1, partial [Funneliformis caledonium]